MYGLVVVKELGQVTTTSATRSTAPSSGIAPLDLPIQDSQPASTSVTEIEPPLSAEAARESGLAPDAGRIRSKSSIFTETGDLTYRHLPGRYVLVAAGGTVKFFLGLQDMFEFTLGPSEFSPPQGAGAGNEGAGGGGSVATAPAPNLEIVSMDAFERKDERGCQLILVVSIARVSIGSLHLSIPWCRVLLLHRAVPAARFAHILSLIDYLRFTRLKTLRSLSFDSTVSIPLVRVFENFCFNFLVSLASF